MILHMNKTLSIFFGIGAGMLWALSSVCAQYLYGHADVSTNWVVSVRMIGAGLFLLVYLFFFRRSELKEMLHNRNDLTRAALTGIAGTMMMQYTFFLTIQYAGAAAATVLQYVSPVILLVYTCIEMRRKPKGRELLAVCLSVTGVFLLCFGGGQNTARISAKAALIGLSSAGFMAVASVIPAGLYRKYSVSTVMCIAFLTGGTVLYVLFGGWNLTPSLSADASAAFLGVILIGSVFGYLSYGRSIQLGSAKNTALYSSVEPAAAALSAWLFLHDSMTLMMTAGLCLVLCAVVLTTLSE